MCLRTHLKKFLLQFAEEIKTCLGDGWGLQTIHPKFQRDKMCTYKKGNFIITEKIKELCLIYNSEASVTMKLKSEGKYNRYKKE